MTTTDDKNINDSEIHTYTEFGVKKNSAAKTVFIRAALAALLCAAVACTFIFVNWWLGAACILLSVVFMYFILPFTGIEYRYTISDGVWRFEKICSAKHTDTVLELRLDGIISLAPQSKKSRARVHKVYDFSGSGSDEEVYGAVFEKDGERSMVLFNCTPKALGILTAGCENLKDSQM